MGRILLWQAVGLVIYLPASLFGETIHSLLDFYVDTSIVFNSMQVELANDLCWDEIYGEPHLFKMIKRCVEIEMFHINVKEFCSRCEDSRNEE